MVNMGKMYFECKKESSGFVHLIHLPVNEGVTAFIYKGKKLERRNAFEINIEVL